ncbi:Syntaxin 6C [Monocercomonoides exilis]|uniref:Syntaxin 6C n=1 Tax=Monocercomonoides exilis TaxID=2049356 RepID=UPI00355AAE7F|nr:Syntaxin 6C [Monocercomonoides exilis]
MASDSSSMDPFFLIKGEIEESVSILNEKYEKWNSLLDNGNQDDYQYATYDLKESIETLLRDLQMLSESIDVTEANPLRYNVSHEEIEKRRAFVRSIQMKSKKIEKSMESASVKEKNMKKQKESLLQTERRNKMSKLDEELVSYNQRSIEEQNQEQEMITRQQDDRLDALHQVTGRLTEMTVEMGHELDNSNQEIEKATRDVEQNERKIGVLNKAIDKLRKSQNKGKCCLILILLIILIGLLIFFFKTIF